MSDDIVHAVGEVVIAIDALVESRIEPLGDADLAMQDLETRLETLATLVATLPLSARREAALARAKVVKPSPDAIGLIGAMRGGSAPISKEAIRRESLKQAKRIVARAYGLEVAELEARLDAFNKPPEED